MFRRILIANRGEIAVRVIHACRELGVESVAVYSDADANALHVSLADRAVRIGPAAAAARNAGAEAIHPGYGFLSEHHAFASACATSGVVFIGPPADVMACMGSKMAARQVAVQCGVPVVPGETPADQSDEAIALAARRLDLPVLIKPSEGGGGIGMKTVRDAASLLGAIGQARREALAAFGDGTLYVERLIGRPRHVEVQVLGDHHGNVVHLFERECSLPRRHAIEVRVYAEDPAQDDLPQAGPLRLYREPSMPGVRIDAGVTEDGEISVHYDPMIAKLIAWGATRERARRRAVAGLRNYPILGVRNNVPFLIALLEHPAFVNGECDTGFVDAERRALLAHVSGDLPPEALAVAADARGSAAPLVRPSRDVQDPWISLRGWRA